jgi:hypothetical protein
MTDHKEELKPILKLIGWPLILLVWAVHRVTHVRYVNSLSFTEYWKQL